MTGPAIDPALEEARSHHKAGRFAEAEALYRQILETRPDRPEVLSKMGAALAAQGKFDAAVQVLGQALEHDPGLAEAHSNLGGVLQIQGNLDAAVFSLRRALAIDPGLAPAQVSLGNIFMRQGDTGAAAQAYRLGLDIDPGFVPAHNGLGAAMLAEGRLDDAETALGMALDLDPDHPESLSNLGNLLRTRGKFGEAVDSFERALARQPGLIEAHTNLGNTLKSLGDMEAAIASFKRALGINPKNAEAHWNLAQVFLLQGRLKDGWQEYEWRTKCGDFRPMTSNVDGPRWDGSDLGGKTILLYTEQGLGDSIQFIRYAPLVAARGGRVVVLAPEPLLWLFRRIGGIEQAVSRIDELASYDVQAPLPSLPYIFASDEDTIPADTPYLHLPADVDRTADWGDRLGTEGFRIGITWQGNPAYKADASRSMELKFFEPLAKIPDVRLICLQKENGLEQLKDLPAGMAVETLGEDFDTGSDAFIDAAAVMMNLDLIVTSDTSIAHLAGALARPVWVLLPFVPDWRWMLDRDDSPWYPTMRLFRQQTHGDWPGVFEEVKAALRQRMED